MPNSLENLLTNKYFCLVIIIILAVVLFMYYRQTIRCDKEGMINADLNPAAFEEVRKPWATQEEVRSGGMYMRVDDEFSKHADQVAMKNITKNNGGRVQPPGVFMKRGDQIFDDYERYNDNLRKKRAHEQAMAHARRSQDGIEGGPQGGSVRGRAQPGPENPAPVASQGTLAQGSQGSQGKGSHHAHQRKEKNGYEWENEPSRTNLPPKPQDNRPDLSQCQPCDCDAYVKKYKDMLMANNLDNVDYDSDLDSETPQKKPSPLTPSAAAPPKGSEGFRQMMRRVK